MGAARTFTTASTCVQLRRGLVDWTLPGSMVTGADMEPASIDERIWQVVALIPAGRVATYGDVAARAGMPGSARRVGLALRRLPADTRIPWHRVINAAGRLSLPPGSPSHQLQRERLRADGVVLHGENRIDLGRYGWSG